MTSTPAGGPGAQPGAGRRKQKVYERFNDLRLRARLFDKDLFMAMPHFERLHDEGLAGDDEQSIKARRRAG
jgi:hypothetical protein